MKSAFVLCSLLAASAAYGALTTPPAGSPRLIDYQTWFDGFDVASDKTVYNEPYPDGNLPPAFDVPGVRNWTGWQPNWSPNDLPAPIVNDDLMRKLPVELVFLGETASWWNDLGVRISSESGFTEFLVADGVQAFGSLANTRFGDFAYFFLNPGERIDFFLNATNSRVAGNGDHFDASAGGRYYAFDQSLTIPASAGMQSFWGTLLPYSSVRGESYAGIPFTIFGYEDIRDGQSWDDSDHNDMLFGVRSSFDLPVGLVPEPSTYGFIGAAALLALIGYRRLRNKA